MKYKIGILLFLIVILLSCFYTVNATVLSGTLKDTNGELSGTTIYLTDESKNDIYSAETDDDGKFEFDVEISDGKYSFRVDGYNLDGIEQKEYSYSPQRDVEILAIYPQDDDIAQKKVNEINEQLNYIYSTSFYNYKFSYIEYDGNSTNVIEKNINKFESSLSNSSITKIMIAFINENSWDNTNDFMESLDNLSVATSATFVLVPDNDIIKEKLEIKLQSMEFNKIGSPPRSRNFTKFTVTDVKEDMNSNSTVKEIAGLDGTIYSINSNGTNIINDYFTIGDPNDNFTLEDMTVVMDDGSTPHEDGGRRRWNNTN